MTYILRSIYDLIHGSFVGAWWFEGQAPLDLDPIPATITNEPDEDSSEDEAPKEGVAPDGFIEIDDGTPLPPPAGHDKPICTVCGDPNFSLEGDVCIACRVGVLR